MITLNLLKNDPSIKRRLASLANYYRHREYYLDYQRKQRAENREKYKEQNRRLYLKNRAYYHEKTLKKYGLTPDLYSKMDSEQGSKCSICSYKDPKRKLSVDHCHKTGKVRSLLCVKCNTSLGLVDDRIEILEGMIEYLKRHA